jgi:hypothetical protein
LEKSTRQTLALIRFKPLSSMMEDRIFSKTKINICRRGQFLMPSKNVLAKSIIESISYKDKIKAL